MVRIIIICLSFIPLTCNAITLVEKQAYVQKLQNQIYELDAQIASCNKNKTAWAVTTTLGTLGTIGTGVGVAVQAGQLRKMKTSGATNTKDSKGDTK